MDREDEMNGKEIRSIYTVWLRDIVRFRRDKTQILGSLARPVLWLLFLGAGMGPVFHAAADASYMHFIFPGIIAMNLIFASFLSAISIIWDREFGFLKEILVAPISRSAIALGKAASGSTIAVIQGLVVVAFAPLIHLPLTFRMLVLLVPSMFVVAFTCTSLGIVIASRMTSFEGFGTIANFVIMPMFFLSGGIFPLDRIPVWLKLLTHLNPLTYGVDQLRWILSGVHRFPILFDLSFNILFSALMLTLAIALFKRSPA